MLLKVNDSITKEYDIIIIGAGLAGMTAANILGRNNHKVLLLESHNKLGGFATWFYRHDRSHTFDISLHGFPVGMIKTCRKYWSKEIADSIVQLKDVRFINPQFEVQTEFTKVDFTNKLIHYFGIPESTVNAFFDHLSKMNFYDDNKMTNRELFDLYFKGRNDVVRFLMEPITYANGSTLDEPAITYGIVFSNFMSKGVYTFKGGTDQLILKMRGELLKNNVDIKMQAKVDKININQGRVESVVIKGQTVKTKCVLSNANIKSTIEKLTGTEHFPVEFVEKSRAVRLNSSSSQVYIGFKEGVTIPHIGDLIFTSTYPTYEPERLLDLKVSSRTFSVYYEGSRLAIVASINHRYQDWAKMSLEDYEANKKIMIEDTLVGLEKLIPNVRSMIEHIEAATPKTVERYTLHPEGTSFGTKFEGLEVSMNLPKVMPGLFHAGSVGIIMSGWLGAANYGVIVCNDIENYLSNYK